MGYIDIGGARFERDFVVLCDCKREPDHPLTGVRVVLRLNGAGLIGTCPVCRTEYRVYPHVEVHRSPEWAEAREAVAIATDR